MLIITLTMTIAGIVALSEAKGRFMLPFTSENATEQMQKQLDQVEQDPTLENMKPFGMELWGLSKMTEPSRFTESKLLQHGVYYTTMSTCNKILMLIHVLLGSFCMLLGSFQFWPSFRKKHMKVHRTIGAIYLISVPIAVVTSLLYLANTAPHHIYDHLVAWIALWVFGILSLVSISMAVLALKKKRIFEHQAWMAASFACLMVAPMLRWDWALLAIIFPEIDQETLNLVTMGIMLPETILIGYGLIVINRQYLRPMKQRKPHAFAERAVQKFHTLQPVLYVLAFCSIAANFYYFSLNNGLAGLSFAEKLLPTALIQREHTLLSSSSLLNVSLVLCTGTALLLGLYIFNHLLKKSAQNSLTRQEIALSQILAIFAGIAGVIAVYLGWNIGLAPQNLIFSGGTMYSVYGALIFIFAIAFLMATHRQNVAYMKETLVFLMSLLPFTSIFLLTLFILSFFHLPPDYLDAGQGFVIPVGFSTALLFLAFSYVIFGQATREYN
ncbi:DUF2306 domain-containing protein [Acinetobacter shaoyimingii]|nr:DUF2306 domain-containing protein [Acinetobacter shaoyimingii]